MQHSSPGMGGQDLLGTSPDCSGGSLRPFSLSIGCKEAQSNLERQEQCNTVFSHNGPPGCPGWQLSGSLR